MYMLRCKHGDNTACRLPVEFVKRLVYKQHIYYTYYKTKSSHFPVL